MNRAVRIAVMVIGMLLPATWAFAQLPEEAQLFVAQLETGRPVTYRNLTVVPVFYGKDHGEREYPDPESYLTLDQALEQGVLDIREKDGGDVPWVVVRNRSDKRILVMGGEILSGCKQDRIVARDVLIAPRRKRLLLPVYCVEAGRWHHVSGEFKSEKNLGTYSMRAAAQGSTGNNQSEVWNKVAESNRRLGISSESEAYQDAFRSDEVAGPKIVKACVAAVNGYDQEAALSAKQAEQFLNALQWMRYQRRPGVDLGFEYFGELKDFTVNTLVYEDTMFHLGAVAHD
jgi:hypothetical protein